MKKIMIVLFAVATCNANAQNKVAPTLKSVLLEQLKTTLNKKD